MVKGMISNIPYKAYRISSVILFVMFLFSSIIIKSLKANGSDPLLFTNSIILLILQMVVLYGYYKLSVETKQLLLKVTSAALIIITLGFYIANTLIRLNFGTSAIFKSHLLYSPHYIIGLGYIFFSFSIFRTRRLNNKNIIPLGIVSLLNGLVFLSISLYGVSFFSRILYFGFLCYYMFPAVDTGEIKLYMNNTTTMDTQSDQAGDVNNIKYFFISLKTVLIQIFKHWTFYGIILISFAAVFFPVRTDTLNNQNTIMIFMLLFSILICTLYFVLINSIIKKFIPYPAALNTFIVLKAFILHSLKIMALFILLLPLATLPLVYAYKNGSIPKVVIAYIPRLLFFAVYFWSLMGYTSSLIKQSSVGSFKNSLQLLKTRYTIYNVFFLLLIILVQPLFTNPQGNILLKLKNFIALSLMLLIMPVSYLFLTKFTYNFRLLKDNKTGTDY